jgi:hypothetical protein
MDRWVRWVVAIVATAGIIALIAFARGGAERGNPDASPAPAANAIHLTV